MRVISPSTIVQAQAWNAPGLLSVPQLVQLSSGGCAPAASGVPSSSIAVCIFIACPSPNSSNKVLLLLLLQRNVQLQQFVTVRSTLLPQLESPVK